MARLPDHYSKRAHRENYLARSVYKLQEINEKYHLIQPENRILDLGSAPGSWLQYTSRIVGPKGFVLGLDLQAIKTRLPDNTKTLQADIFTLDSEKFKEQWGFFSVILSDMAPHTTGIKIVDQQRSLELAKASFSLAQAVLNTHGHYLVKVFQGEDILSFFQEINNRFHKTYLIKPKSSRNESFEIFILGLDRK